MDSNYKVSGRLRMSARSSAKKSDGSLALPAPFFLELDPASNILQPPAIGPDGIAVRVPAFDGMMEGQQVTLHWKGKDENSLTARVLKVGYCLDFFLPLDWLIDSISLGQVSIRYTVNGFDEFSPVTEVFVYFDFSPNPKVVVPDFLEGEFDPSAVADPGLKLVFPEIVTGVWPLWCSYGRDGRRIATIQLPTFGGGEAYIAPSILEQTELDGDVWISYAGDNSQGEWVESRFTQLRVVGGAKRNTPPTLWKRFVARVRRVVSRGNA